MPTVARTEPRQSQELHPDCPCECQEPKHLSRLPASRQMKEELDPNWGVAGTQTRHFSLEWGHHGGGSTHCA